MRRAVADPRRPTVDEAAAAARGVDGLAQRRHVDDADGRTGGVVHGQQVRVERDTVGEGLGAVDRVDDPGASRPAVSIGLLLADDGVVGEAGGDLVAQELLGRLVGGGDRRAVALALDLEVVGAEPVERHPTGLADQVDGHLEQVGQLRTRVGRGSGGRVDGGISGHGLHLRTAYRTHGPRQ